ncbi:MAG: VCBS repeat-containing protein [Planctomycetes bacterium]|nr:VCBS repeat-containing protein [Planctomycetota bacterium]
MKGIQRRVAVWIAVAGMSVLVGGAPPERRDAFEVLHLTAHGRRLDTLFYDFTGDGIMDALAVSIDYDVDPPVRWLALHAGAAKRPILPENPTQIWAVAEFAAALAVADVVPEGGVDICLLAPDGVYFHAFQNGSMAEEPRKLLHTATFFDSPSPQSLPIWSLQQDLSGDRRDDLILPVPGGYKVYFQTEPGRFGRVARLEAEPAANRVPSLGPRRFAVDWERGLARGFPPTSALFDVYEELPHLLAVDLNGDGLSELVSIQGNVLIIYFQQAPGVFRSRPSSYRIPALSEERRKDTVNVSDVRFRDLDGNGIMDLVVTRIEGQLGLFESIKTNIYTHIGTGLGNFQADANIHIDGVSLNPEFIDMNGDGRLDCLTSRLRTDILGKAVEGFVLGDITITYEVFQFDARRNAYVTTPVYARDVRVRIEDIQKKGAASRPLFFVPGDLSGDGRPDAVVYDPKTSAVEVYRGRDAWAAGGRTKNIDFEKDLAGSYQAERDPKYMTFIDLDLDGRQDILLNYAGGQTVLLSRI